MVKISDIQRSYLNAIYQLYTPRNPKHLWELVNEVIDRESKFNPIWATVMKPLMALDMYQIELFYKLNNPEHGKTKKS